MADMHGGGAGGDLAALVLTKGAVALGGLAGAFVRHLFPPRKPWRQRIAEYIGGALTAVHTGPVAGPLLYNAVLAVCDWWNIPPTAALAPASVDSLAAFLCGALGLTFIEGLFMAARKWSKTATIPGPPAAP